MAAAAIFMAGCNKPFKKAAGGLQYKIISDGKGKKMVQGNFFEMQVVQQYKGANKDTILFDSRNFANQIVPLDSVSIPPVYYKIFADARKGDSIIIKQSTDSIMKQNPGATPEFIKKGAFIFAHYKIVNIYETRQAADSANKVLMAMAQQKDSIKKIDQLKKDDKTISDYLSKNKITATKAPKGTYVEIINPGEGDVADTGKVLKVLYTGRLMDGGTIFDSNTDPQFNHLQAFPVYMGAEGGVITGWTDGLSLLKKGAKAKLYIPSALAYGAQGRGKEIKPNANLMFDVEIADMVTTAQARAEAEAERKQMEAQQKKAMDSMQQARKEPASKK